jgi:hypothetical protein
LRTKIPATAFLQVADVRYPESKQPNDPKWVPKFCGTAALGPTNTVAIRQTATFFFGDPNKTLEGTVAETITQYRGAGAPAYLQELRRLVAACPVDTKTEPGDRHTIVPGASLGDESVVVRSVSEVTVPYGPEEEKKDLASYLVVIRVGNAVTVLQVEGWEMVDPSAEQVEHLSRAAHDRLRAWLTGP